MKTGSITASDLKGLGEFVSRFPKFRPLVLCDDAARPTVERAGLEAMAWSDFLLGALRPFRGRRARDRVV